VGKVTEVLYIGADGGFYVASREVGGSWTTTQPKMWRLPVGVAAVAVSPAAPELVYVGTIGQGVMRSRDGGRSVDKPSYGRVGPGKVRSLTADPHVDGRVWAGGEPVQLFVSDDEAASWRVIEAVQDHPWVPQMNYPDHTVAEPHVRHVVFDPEDGNIIYLALQLGHMFKSVDGGETWNLCRDGLDIDVHMIDVDPRQTNRLLAVAGGISEARGVFESTDAGETWSARATNFAQNYSLALAVRPDNPDIAYTSLAMGHPGHWAGRPTVAESVHVRTVDRGATWEALDLSNIDGATRQLVTAFSFDPEAPDRLYAALTGGEIVVTEDGGDNWSSTGITVAGVESIHCVRL
jgi:photosystem II stability/assembly factor-like uncharacterized protein